MPVYLVNFKAANSQHTYEYSEITILNPFHFIDEMKEKMNGDIYAKKRVWLVSYQDITNEYNDYNGTTTTKD